MLERWTASVENLVERHRQMAPRLAERRRECTVLWYADLGVEVESEEAVRYYCTGCGVPLSMYLEEFLHRDSNDDLRCERCRGDIEERGGPVD